MLLFIAKNLFFKETFFSDLN